MFVKQLRWNPTDTRHFGFNCYNIWWNLAFHIEEIDRDFRVKNFGNRMEDEFKGHEVERPIIRWLLKKKLE